MGSKKQLLTKDIVLTALAAALLSAGKQALAWIPNVEVVTLLVMLYAACFKLPIAFIATNVFVLIECFIWGIHTWVIHYFIHWNIVAFGSFLLARVFKLKNRFIYLAFTIIITATFGVMTTAVDSIIGAGRTGRTFSLIFKITYLRGIYFYIVHVVGNAAINITLFAPLRDLLTKLMKKYYGRDVFLKKDVAKPATSVENATAPASLTDEHARDTMKSDESGSESDTSRE